MLSPKTLDATAARATTIKLARADPRGAASRKVTFLARVVTIPGRGGGRERAPRQDRDDQRSLAAFGDAAKVFPESAPGVVGKKGLCTNALLAAGTTDVGCRCSASRKRTPTPYGIDHGLVVVAIMRTLKKNIAATKATIRAIGYGQDLPDASVHRPFAPNDIFAPSMIPSS